MKIQKTIIVITTVMIILFSGCIDESDKGQPTPTSTDTPTTTETKTGIQIPKVIDLAKEDLAQTLSVSIDDIKLSNVEEVTWPTSALGYPKPDEQYLQVETPGYKIFLTYNDTAYEYHSDTKETIVPPPEGKKQGQ